MGDGVRIDGDVAVVTVSGELDIADDQLTRRLDDASAAGATRIVIDLLNVTFIDSSVVRALVLAHRKVAGSGGWVRIVYTHHLIRRVIEICGLADLFPQYASCEAALRHLPTAHLDGEESIGGRGR